ncbi:MAG: TonB-dependent receptor [Pedobacter sp.]|nr:MAG: TonB-dependent receptor [Pedobacter sp.]
MKQFSVLCCLIFVSLFGNAQQSELKGNVVGEDGVPISDAKISIQATTLYTDSLGDFSYNGKINTSYRIRVSKTGYHTEVRTFLFEGSGTRFLVKLETAAHQLKEVQVSDNRIQVLKNEESLNVEIVNQDFIKRNLGGSLMKSLERLPGIKTIGIGSGQSKPLIRGLGFNRVVVLDKGVKHEGQQWGADHGLELDQFAAGEVELLKGAASFMYGADAIAGAISVKPAKPPLNHTLGGSVDIIGKTNNSLYGTSLNLHGRTDRLFFDSRFTYQNYGDYRVPTDKVYIYDFEVPLNNQYLRNTAGRETGTHLSTGFLSEKFNSVFHISNVYNRSGFFANAHGLEPRRVDTEFHDRDSRDIQMPSQQVNHFKIINKSDYRVANHKIEMELGYQRNFRQEFSQYVNHGYMPPIFPSYLTISPNLEREFDKQVYTANFRDEVLVGKHQLTGGINIDYQNNTINGWTFLVPAFNQLNSGAFLYDQFSLNEKVILHGAVRYDFGNIRLKRYTDWFESVLTGGDEASSERLVRADNLTRSFNSLVWSLGMNYNPEKFSFKANVGKSFRMPIAKELGANGVNYHYFSYERGDPTLSPEQSYQIDASFGWKESKWSVQISPFYNYFPNYIYLNPTANYDYFYGAGNQVFNYAQSEVMRYGGEIQFNYKITNRLSTEVLGEYLYAQQLSGAKKGYALPFSPPPSVLFNLTYSPEDGKRLKKTYLSVDYRLTDQQHNIVPPEKKTPGYAVVNLQAGTTLNLNGQSVMISLQAQNLMDTKYLNHTSFYRLIELPEAGRNIILSLKVPFTLLSAYPKQ